MSSGQETRKTVTVLFGDLVDSTALAEQLDPETFRLVLARYYDAARTALEAHGGLVAKFIGDAVMATFGVPQVREDDALRALRAALDVQAALEVLNAELREHWGVALSLRIGVNTGEVVGGPTGESQAFVVGDAVNVAARVEQAAGPGEVLLTRATHRLAERAVDAEPAGLITVKGRAAPVEVLRLRAVRSELRGPRDDVPLVGRDAELTALEHALAEAAEADRCRVVTLLGEPGIGKTRLGLELERRVGATATVLRARCLAYGTSIALWPVAEALRELAAVGVTDAPGPASARLAELVPEGPGRERVIRGLLAVVGLAEVPVGPEQVSWAIRTVFAALARDRPLVLVLDDAHLAQDGLLDVVAAAVAAPPGAACLVVCLARADGGPAVGRLTGEQALGAVVPLGELDALERRQLGEHLLARAGHPVGLVEQVTRQAGGNPLFLEEHVAVLDDDRADSVPPTLEALAAAHLDRLAPQHRRLAARAAVLGAEFGLDALRGLGGHADADELRAQLEALQGAGILAVRDAGGDHQGFRHGVLRDVAYRSLLRRERAELHARHAAWIVTAAGSRLPEYEAIVAHHLERAVHEREQLGPDDGDQRALRHQAAARLGRCGDRELDRGDPRSAGDLFARALAVDPDATATRPALELRLGVALTGAGALHRADEVLSALVDRTAEDPVLRARARVERALGHWRRGTSDHAGLVRVAREAIAILGSAQDDAGLARALTLEARVLTLPARYGEQAIALERALGHARSAGDRITEVEALVWLIGAWQLGPMPVDQALARIAAEQAGAASPSPLTAAAHVNRAVLLAMDGQADAARAATKRGLREFEQLGSPLERAAATQQAGMAERLVGDLTAAERHLRQGFDALVAMGERLVAATSALLLAELLLAQDRPQDARAVAREAEPHVTPDDVDARVRQAVVAARLLAHDGDLAAAAARVGEALELARATDGHLLRVEAATGAAEVHAHLGDAVRADALRAEALGVATAKGDRVSAARLSVAA